MERSEIILALIAIGIIVGLAVYWYFVYNVFNTLVQQTDLAKIVAFTVVLVVMLLFGAYITVIAGAFAIALILAALGIYLD